MNIAYVRVSTVDQNEARQVETLKKYDIEKWFIEKASAKDTNRPQLKQMLSFARKGDTIYVHDFTRLARSTKDLLDIVEMLKEKEIHLVSNKESIDTSTPTGKLMLTFLAGIAEFDRENLLERQREGIAIAKRNGVYKGRKPFRSDKFDELYEEYMHRKISKTEFAKLLGVSRPTLYRLIGEKNDVT